MRGGLFEPLLSPLTGKPAVEQPSAAAKKKIKNNPTWGLRLFVLCFDFLWVKTQTEHYSKRNIFNTLPKAENMGTHAVETRPFSSISNIPGDCVNVTGKKL